MLKTKLASIAAAAALSFGAIGSAQAVVITAGDYKISLDNFDRGTSGYGGTTAGVKCTTVLGCDSAASSPALSGSSYDTMGIFYVARIEDKNGATIFTPGPGNYLTGVFGGLSDYYVETTCSVVAGCSTTTLSTGGVWALYQNSTTWNPALGSGAGAWDPLAPGGLTYPGITGGSLWLNGVFGAGLIAGQPGSTYYANFDPTLSGKGSAFLDIKGGSAANMFKPTGSTGSYTDPNGGKHDMFLTTTFDDLNKSASDIGWTVKSVTQITGTVNQVPEPGTVALAGLALLGAGLASRRRKS